MKRRVRRARGDSLTFTLKITALDSQGAVGRYPMGHIHTAAILSRENSLRSRRLEVARECLLLAHPFFLVPTTFKRLLRRLPERLQKLCLTTLDLAVKNLGAMLDR